VSTKPGTVQPLLVAMFIPALHILHRSILVRQFEQAATTDPKTGLLNALAWHAFATKELEKVQRNGGTLGVLMIDIDHFKLFNDRYGHFVGDRVLQSVAGTLRRAVRRDDCVGRFGGEEFVVALPDVDQDQAVEIGERICDGVRKLPVPVGQDEGESVPSISVSVGVAVYPAAGSELDEVLLKADNAMFGAKDAGRDQVRATTFGSIPSNRFRPGPTSK
jgi:diguanylate cyclase (GGDEF)-like protein